MAKAAVVPTRPQPITEILFESAGIAFIVIRNKFVTISDIRKEIIIMSDNETRRLYRASLETSNKGDSDVYFTYDTKIVFYIDPLEAIRKAVEIYKQVSLLTTVPINVILLHIYEVSNELYERNMRLFAKGKLYREHLYSMQINPGRPSDTRKIPLESLASWGIDLEDKSKD
jgi:hypothetical protein